MWSISVQVLRIRQNILEEPSVAHLRCGPVEVRATYTLLESRNKLSCGADHTFESTERRPWAHLTSLICHAVPMDTFEPINTIHAIKKYKKLFSCDFSLWQKNISLESALTSVQPACFESSIHDRPFDNCKLSNVMFEDGQLIGFSSSPSLELKLNNFITIERRSRRIDGVPQNLHSRIQNLKPTTLKLPIRLLPLNSAKMCGTMLWGTSILIHRWHPDSIYHLMESLFRLYKTMKLHSLLGTTTRIVHLDPLEGTRAMFMGHEVHRSGIESTGRFKYEEFLHAFSKAIFHMDMFQEKPVCFERAIVVGYPEYSLGLFTKKASDLLDFREFLLKKLNLKREKRQQQITVLSRSNILGYGETSLEHAHKRRHIINEEELVACLRNRIPKPVELVKLNELTVHQQILLMFRTEILISVHSAALINMLWLRESSVVIQIHAEGTHLGSNSMLRRNHLLVRACGASFHMVTPVENMADSLNLKYDEIIVGGSDSKLNQFIAFCEDNGNRAKLSRVCCDAFEREERLQRFAKDFSLDEMMLVSIVEKYVTST